MIGYINPKHGDDDNGRFAETEDEARRFAFKTHKAGIEAHKAICKQHPGIPHPLRETHKPPPPDPQISPIEGMIAEPESESENQD